MGNGCGKGLVTGLLILPLHGLDGLSGSASADLAPEGGNFQIEEQTDSKKQEQTCKDIGDQGQDLQ